jgi:MFS family permease
LSFLVFLRANFPWLCAGFLLTAFSGFGQTFFIGLSAGALRSEFGLSHGEFGTIYMLSTLASALSLPWVGKSLDRFAVPPVAAVVMILLALFCFGMAVVSAVWMLVVVIYGLRLFGQGMMTNTSMTAVGRWFDAQRGKAVSVAALGFPFAEAIMPLTFVALTAAVGWRTSWALAGGFLLLVALPVVLWLLRKDRVPQNRADTAKAADVRHWTRAEVLRDPVFWLLSAGIQAPPFISTAILFHQVYLVELRGWTLELFASAFVVMAAVAVIASLTLGTLIDRFSARALVPFMLLPLGAGCAILASIHAPLGAFLFMAFLGISNGFVGTLAGALWPEIYGTRYLGSVRSLVFSLMVFSSAAGPGVYGYLIDLGVSIDLQMAAMSIYCFATAAVLSLAALRLRARNTA